jgi:hypothetical protein
MNPKFPLDDVTIRRVETPRIVTSPLYVDSTWQISQHEFAMQVEGVGSFYACNGKDVEYAPSEDATQASVELYLNGSVYGAILHQRNILPIHGSSFIWNGKGIMLCGESGAGKSSLTAAFCMAGAQFLTDDVTPIVIIAGKPEILPLSDRIKLWDDSLQQLNQEKSCLTPITFVGEKYYFPMEKGLHQSYPLYRIFIIEPAAVDTIETYFLKGVESFAALRNEVYRWEYLSAMPDTETRYLEKLLIISRDVLVMRVRRPAGISIEEMIGFLHLYILEGHSNE